jgi:hypothetical protein
LTGPHDGIGAMVKNKLRHAEFDNNRLYTTEIAFNYLQEHLRDAVHGAAFLKNWSAYRIRRFKLLHVKNSDFDHTTGAELVSLAGTMKLYQFIGDNTQQRAAALRAHMQAGAAAWLVAKREQGLGLRKAGILEHKLTTRMASCYCCKCRYGDYDECEAVSRGFAGLFGKQKSTPLKEHVPVL